VSAGCSEQGTPGAGGRADLFFDTLRKNTVAGTMPADDRLREGVAVTCRNVRPIEEDHPCFSLDMKQRNMVINFEHGSDVASEKYLDVSDDAAL